MKTKALTRYKTVVASSALVILAAIGGYWYASPYVTLYQLKQASKNKDSEAFNKHIDYESLRADLKAELTKLISSQLKQKDSVSEEEVKAGAALGAILVNAVVDKVVTPETLMRSMGSAGTTPPVAHDAATPASGPSAAAADEDVQWEFERPTANALIAFASSKTQADSPRIGFVFTRSGFVTWKLSSIRFPALSQPLPN